MRRHGCDPLAQHEPPSLAGALYAQLEADRAQSLRCQRGEHDMLATASPGVVICRLCRTLGVCLWCGLTLPHGACVVVCSKHLGAAHWQARHQRTAEAQTPNTKEGQQHEPR
jgi:hypothetical protein